MGVAAGQSLTSAARIGKVVGACAIDTDASNDATCLDAFMRRFGARALRRPLTAEEIAFYKSVYGTDTKADPAAYADVIGVMLNAPQFLYFVEHGDQMTASPNVYQVSPYRARFASLVSILADATRRRAVASGANDGTLARRPRSTSGRSSGSTPIRARRRPSRSSSPIGSKPKISPRSMRTTRPDVPSTSPASICPSPSSASR